MPSITVAAAQMNSQDDVAKNLAQAGELVAEAAAAGATLALLPENFAFMGEEADKRALAESVAAEPAPGEGPIVAALRSLARRHGLHLVAGGMPERSEDPARPWNTSVVLDPAGHVVARYRKIHLFDVNVGDGASYRESASTSPGAAAVVAPLPGLKLGLSVCYDVRFPELYRRLADLGAELATVPAAFTLMTGKDHWHVLLRARAIESQMWVLAAGQCGEHPRGRRTYGKSCLIDPWGDVVAQASDGVGLALGRVDLAQLARVRASLPCLAHRRAIE